jgi:CRP/FNR family cyclic AMP-dependent transcriptional regulator
LNVATRLDEPVIHSHANGNLIHMQRPDGRSASPDTVMLHPHTWAAMEALGERRWVDRGAALFRVGEPPMHLFLILSGRVKVSLSSRDGEDALGTVLGAGEILGSASVVDGRPRMITATADEPTEVLVLPRDALEQLIGTGPTIALDIYRVLVHQLRRSYAFIEDTIFLDVAGRLAKKLLELAEAYGQETDDGVLIDLPLTQLELASMVGVTRETVNKHLGSYRARGIIDMRDHRVLIRQPEVLRRRIY